MASLSNLNDKQNLLLTQLSYQSDVLKDNYNGMTLSEIMNSDIQDGETISILNELCNAGLGDLKIKDVGNDFGTGFGAIAFTDESGNTGFSYRGTDGVSVDSLNDWGDNVLAAATGTSPQTVQAEAFFDLNRDANGNNYLYGHSKGGELSESVYVNNYMYIKGVHLLNPQPINPYSLTPDQSLAMKSDKVDIVIVEGDYVWFLGKLPSYGNIRIAKSNGGNSHVYSSISNMFDENGMIQKGTQPWWEYAAYFAISNLIKPIQIAGAKIGLVYNCVVRVVDFVKHDLVEQAKMFIAWVSDRAEEIFNDVKEFAINLRNFLVSTVDRVKNWLKRNFNEGYKYASANPLVKVDTYKMREYAKRLQAVNKRIVKIDQRMDSLYWKVGLLDIWKLLQADVFTGYSWRLSRVASYLNETASDFDEVEKDITNSI